MGDPDESAPDVECDDASSDGDPDGTSDNPGVSYLPSDEMGDSNGNESNRNQQPDDVSGSSASAVLPPIELAPTEPQDNRPRWWQQAAEHWPLTTVIIMVVGVLVAMFGIWIQGKQSSLQVTVHLPPEPYSASNVPQVESDFDSEITPGESACRDTPEDYSGLSTWGPPRNLLPEDKVSEFPAFNIDDVSVYGNERWFYNVREKTPPNTPHAGETTPWKHDISVEPGKTYVLRAFIHNSAGKSDEDIATDTRISVHLPTCTGRRIASTAFIASSNAAPPEIWDSVHFFSDEVFNLAYVPGSAILCNNYFLCNEVRDGATISNDFLTSTGALIGFDSLDGKLPGNYYYSAWFYFEVRPQFAGD